MIVDVKVENYQKQNQKKLLKYRIFQKRRIKNRDKLTNEDLIITLLKSANSAAERNYMKHFNNNNTDDDTYDDKIRGKISDINMILSRMLKKCLKNFAQTSVIIMICMFSVIYYCLQMFLKNVETNALKYMDLILLISYLQLDQHRKRA